ncbi:MAG: hypothetical protein ACYS6K_21385 [Planctomycetota bacterium]
MNSRSHKLGDDRLETLYDRRLKPGNHHPHTRKLLKNLIELSEAWSKPEQAEE